MARAGCGMRILPVLFALMLAGPALAAERSYSITDYDRIRLDAPVRVTVATGRSPSARATGDQAGLDRLKVEVQGRTLVIGRNVSAWSANAPTAPVSLALSAFALRAAAVNGAGTLAIDRLRGPTLQLVVAGSGAIEAKAIEADVLSVIVAGDGRATVAGTAKRADYALRGTGGVVADALIAEDLKLAADGPGDVKAAARRTAAIASSGSGAISVAGKPACTVRATGSAEVRCGD